MFHISPDDTGKSAVWAAQRCVYVCVCACLCVCVCAACLWACVCFVCARVMLCRVPDDHIALVANGFVIRQMDLSDRANFLASANIHEVAIRAGLWDPNKGSTLLFLLLISFVSRAAPFDFAVVYGLQVTTYHEEYIARSDLCFAKKSLFLSF